MFRITGKDNAKNKEIYKGVAFNGTYASENGWAVGREKQDNQQKKFRIIINKLLFSEIKQRNPYISGLTLFSKVSLLWSQKSWVLSWRLSQVTQFVI